MLVLQNPRPDGPPWNPGGTTVPISAAAEGAATVSADGEIDISNADALRDRVLAALAEHPAVAVDMSAVTFIDCAGLRALLAARKWADRHGRTLTVREPSAPVRRLLTLTGLNRHLRST